MSTRTEIPDRTPIGRTAIGADEAASDALARAAKRGHPDLALLVDDPEMGDQIDAEALDALVAHRRSRGPDGQFVLATELWGLLFVVTTDAVEVSP